MAYFNKRKRNNDTTIIGFIIIVASILFGVFVGGWVFFIGGIVQVVESLKATPVEAVGVAVGILRVVVASTVGMLIAAFGAMFGASLLK